MRASNKKNDQDLTDNQNKSPASGLQDRLADRAEGTRTAAEDAAEDAADQVRERAERTARLPDRVAGGLAGAPGKLLLLAQGRKVLMASALGAGALGIGVLTRILGGRRSGGRGRPARSLPLPFRLHRPSRTQRLRSRLGRLPSGLRRSSGLRLPGGTR
jgi:hypothetical protein